MKVTIDFQKLATELGEIEPLDIHAQKNGMGDYVELKEQLNMIVAFYDHNQPLQMDKLDVKLLKKLYQMYLYQEDMGYLEGFHEKARAIAHIFRDAKPKLGGKKNELFF